MTLLMVSKAVLTVTVTIPFGITEQIIFPEINLDSITRIMGMNITFVTSAQTDEEGYALLPRIRSTIQEKRKQIIEQHGSRYGKRIYEGA